MRLVPRKGEEKIKAMEGLQRRGDDPYGWHRSWGILQISLQKVLSLLMMVELVDGFDSMPCLDAGCQRSRAFLLLSKG